MSSSVKFLRTRNIVATGFITTLLLLSGLMPYWFNLSDKHSQSRAHVATDRLKVNLISNMRDTLQLCTISIIKVLHSTNPGQRSKEFSHLRTLGSTYSKTRDQLFSLPFSTSEDSYWADAKTIMLVNERNQQNVSQLILQENNFVKAESTLYEQLLPNMALLNTEISRILDTKNQELGQSLHTMQIKTEQLQFILITLALLSVALGLLTFSILRQTKLSRRTLQNRTDTLLALYNATTAPNLSYQDQIKEMLQLGSQLLNTDIGAVCKIDKLSNSVECINIHSATEVDTNVGTQYPLDKSFCKLTIESNATVAIHDAGASIYRGHAFYQASGHNTYIATPLMVNEICFGTVCFYSKQAQNSDFSSIHKHTIELISRWIGVTLSRQLALQSVHHEKKIAEDANISKGKFLSNVSREIRTPLNAIIGYSELLLEEKNETKIPNADSDLARIVNSGHHLLSIVNDVIDLAKVEAGPISLTTESVHIDSLISELMAAVKSSLKKQGNILSIDNRDSTLSIQADNGYLFRILIVLLENANKSTTAGKLNFSIYTAFDNKQWVIFEISDNSNGMTESQMNNMFVAFSHENSEISQRFGGTGLGLVLSKYYANLMGGDISIKSIIGEGTTFTIRLPYNAEMQNNHKSNAA